MRKDLVDRLEKYNGMEHLTSDHGFIFWQVTTGENVEIMFISVDEPRKGYGTELIRLMCERIQPYNSVIVFTRENNREARAFYEKLGFKGVIVDNLYKNEKAVLYTILFKELKKV